MGRTPLHPPPLHPARSRIWARVQWVAAANEDLSQEIRLFAFLICTKCTEKGPRQFKKREEMLDGPKEHDSRHDFLVSVKL